LKNTKKHKTKNAELSDEKEFKFVSTNIGEDFLFDEKQSANESTMNFKHLFQIESKYLNAENEMMRMFGSRIVQSERSASRLVLLLRLK
jgi:hypothetical protein